MKQLVIVELTSRQYEDIMERSKDTENGLSLWDYPTDEIGYVMENFKEEDSEHNEKYLALINNRLYELPSDFMELSTELNKAKNRSDIR